MSGKILITGALGNLGVYIGEYFVKQNITPILLANSPRDIKTLAHLPTYYIDIREEVALKSWAETQNIETVIHLASINESFLPNYASLALNINALGTRNVLEAVKSTCKHFIYFSTFHVYGVSEGYVNEETPPQPLNDYALTHYFAEQYLHYYHQKHQIPYTIIRLTNSYGVPKDPQSSKWYLLLNDLAKMAYQQQKIQLQSNGKAQRDFIAMEQVAAITATLANQPATNQTFNLSAHTTYTLIQIAEKVQAVYQERYQKQIPIIVNEKDPYQPKTKLEVDNTKLETQLGYALSSPQYSIENAILQLFEWLEIL